MRRKVEGERVLVQIRREERFERLTHALLSRRELLIQLASNREIEVLPPELDRKGLDRHRANNLAERLVWHLDLSGPGEPARPA